MATLLRLLHIAGGKRNRVCFKAFCSLHGTGKKRVEILRSKASTSITSPRDQRGRHDNRPNRIPADTLQKIKAHIESQMFINQEETIPTSDIPLSWSKMHQLYMEKSERRGWPVVTESFYRQIFCEEYNLRFGVPRSDTCKTCDEYRNKIAALDLPTKSPNPPRTDKHCLLS